MPACGMTAAAPPACFATATINVVWLVSDVTFQQHADHPFALNPQGFFVLNIYDATTNRETNACDIMLYAKVGAAHCGELHNTRVALVSSNGVLARLHRPGRRAWHEIIRLPSCSPPRPTSSPPVPSLSRTACTFRSCRAPCRPSSWPRPTAQRCGTTAHRVLPTSCHSPAMNNAHHTARERRACTRVPLLCQD